MTLWTLEGYDISFTLLGLGNMLTVTGAVATAVGLGILIIARIVYGLTVSAVVPARQVWVSQKAGEGNHVAALTTISSGLSCGGLLGPLYVMAMLVIHPLAPVWIPIVAPVWAVVTLLRLPDTPLQPIPERKNISLKRDCLPYLLCVILLAVAMDMMQLGFSPTLTHQFDTDTITISQQVAWLLGPSVIATLIAQFVVPRPQRLTPVALPLSIGVLVSSGLAIMLTEQLRLFYLDCAVLSFGAALATPVHQLLLNDRLTDDAGAGWLVTSHTLGYGLCALLAPLASETGISIALTVTALFAAVLFTIVSTYIWHYRTIK